MAADLDHQQELKAHSGTYDAFIGMMKWGTVGAILVAVLVVWLIAG